MIYPINVAQEKGYSIAESAALIKEASGYVGDIVFDTKYQDGDMIKILSKEKFRNSFPNFKFCDHKLGIKNTIDYYRNNL